MEKIDRAFLDKNPDIAFYPALYEEALFIEASMRMLGVKWKLFTEGNSAYKAVNGTLVVKKNKMHASPYTHSGRTCTSAQLGWTDSAGFKLSFGMMAQYDFVFRPETREEVDYIRHKVSGHIQTESWTYEDALEHGLKLCGKSLIAANLKTTNSRPVMPCGMKKFEEFFGPNDKAGLAEGATGAVIHPETPDQKFIAALFNEMTRKIDRLEREVAELRAELAPRRIEKPVIGGKNNA